MRAGAGYVTAMIPASLNLIFETRLLEVMTVPLPDDGGALVASAADAVLGRVERADALVLGPGLGRDEAVDRVRPDGRGDRRSCRCCSTPTGSTRTPGGCRRWRGARPRP